jgi:hypothetical protein
MQYLQASALMFSIFVACGFFLALSSSFLPAGDVRGGVNCLLVNVTGTVTWGAASAGATPSGFYHSFVLERGQSASGSNKPVHHIVSASFRTRLIDDPTDSAVGHHLKKKRVFTR